MKRARVDADQLQWQSEIPGEDGVYEYEGPLYEAASGQGTENGRRRINLRVGDGLMIAMYGEDGTEYDITRTREGRWRGPLGPVRIPAEDARKEPEG